MKKLLARLGLLTNTKNYKVYDYSIIGENVRIGNNTVIGSHCVILGEVYIGDNCRIQSHCFIPSGVTILDNVFIGPRVTFLNDKYPPSKGKAWETTIVMDNVTIGGDCTIMPGIAIGTRSLIGAGTLVSRSVIQDRLIYDKRERITKEKYYG